MLSHIYLPSGIRNKPFLNEKIIKVMKVQQRALNHPKLNSPLMAVMGQSDNCRQSCMIGRSSRLKIGD